MSLFVKMGWDILFIHKVFFRNSITFLIFAVKIFRSGESLKAASPENLKYLILRSVLGLAGVLLFFYSIENLSLADSSMLNRLSPFFVIIAASVMLKERITFSNLPLIIIAFTGAALIIKPEFSLSVLPALAGFITAILAGITYTIVRLLKNRETPDKIIFYFSGISVVVMIIPSIIFYRPYTLYQAIILVLIGIFATGGQYFLTLGFQSYRAGELSLVTYSQILFASVLGLIFFNELPDIYSIIGGVLITVSAALFYLKK